MPIWNRFHYARYSIQSIFDQSFKDWEFIAVDDGSDDPTWQLLKECEKLDPRFKPFRLSKHEGLYAALMKGNELAQGEIIVKHDSDDLSLPNRLEVIERYFTKEKPDFFYHAMYQTFEDSEHPELMRRIFLPATKITKRILKEQYVPGCFAYTKKFIEEVPYRKSYCSDDWMLILDAYLKGKKIGFLNEALYEYVLREDSNSMYHEGTGHYEADEKMMQKVLKEEYGINKFKYAERK